MDSIAEIKRKLLALEKVEPKVNERFDNISHEDLDEMTLDELNEYLAWMAGPASDKRRRTR